MTHRYGRLSLFLVSVLALFCTSACRKERAGPGGIRGSEAGPVMIISIDTLRADHIPIYGAAGPETPVIDALAKDSVVFESAYSHVPLTLPSHVTILTGLLPKDNGVRNNLGYRFDSAAHPSVPTLLKARGYDTGAAVSAYVLRGATGLAAAFDDYDDQMDRSPEGSAMGEVQRSGARTVAVAIRWVNARRDQPFFYLLHLFEPHAPYAPPEPFKSRYAAHPYDGEIAAADAVLGQFLDALKSSGVYDRATIILLSDHGEGLGDHGEAQHGIFLYREAIHVPLLLKLPNGEMKGKRVSTPVQLMDVLPTVAAIAGFDIPAGAKGRTLVEIARGNASPDRRIFSETMYSRIHLGWSDLASLIDSRHHYIDAPRAELYDITSDPREKQNVLSENRRVHAWMRTEIQSHDRALDPPANINPEDAAKLTALGYLGSSSSAAATGTLPDPKDGIADFERTGHANILVSQGKYSEAASVLRKIVARNSSFADAWTLLARALDRMGRPEEAIEAYKKTIEVAPMLAPGIAMSMAELYMRTGRFDDAIRHAELALDAHPAAARMAIAQAYLGKKDLASAERESQILIGDPAKRDDAAVLLAQVRIAQRLLPEALALLDAAKSRADAEGKTVPPNFWFARGDALARLSRVPEAAQAFAEEIRLYPRNREAYVRLAVLQTLSGHEADARQTFDLMMRSNPEASSHTLAAETFRTLKRQKSTPR